jgi:hypothetical protein
MSTVQQEHRPEKHVAGLNPAIPVFGQADTQNKKIERGRDSMRAFGLKQL